MGQEHVALLALDPGIILRCPGQLWFSARDIILGAIVYPGMIEAGVVLGLPRATATELVVQTLYGAATMIKETGQHPTVLREQVTSPGGTTAAALRQLDDHKVRAAFITAMEAAAERSHQLASGNG